MRVCRSLNAAAEVPGPGAAPAKGGLAPSASWAGRFSPHTLEKHRWLHGLPGPVGPPRWLVPKARGGLAPGVATWRGRGRGRLWNCPLARLSSCPVVGGGSLPCSREGPDLSDNRLFLEDPPSALGPYWVPMGPFRHHKVPTGALGAVASSRAPWPPLRFCKGNSRPPALRPGVSETHLYSRRQLNTKY